MFLMCNENSKLVKFNSRLIIICYTANVHKRNFNKCLLINKVKASWLMAFNDDNRWQSILTFLILNWLSNLSVRVKFFFFENYELIYNVKKF